ncbi:Activator of Hsp90 ATPase 1 family protein [Anaeromyxobacter dehalogenans 2CP-1]|uniref:Activator of Hsp90 ATPase 1 family protein n=1 Tax=Anaeromyxobacter dehalogenans (strain ATCC BAA-258 / DSM 21875 / 2CP-1) TaxID=455488 RepID=B8J5Q3_ANAD2|nr:SRPBCC domain-containing protein [Anaeromyxobacter dehalogenans]ACL65000.1 Activator of Hsp90 ATPase 1 family protein [Anaeromyxobacter dehalogenans 2CP-1]
MPDIIHRIAIRAPAAKVYEALATVEGVGGWWTRDAKGRSAPGGTLQFMFHRPDGTELGAMEFEVLELKPEREVRWRCTGGPPEWIGTEVAFRLSREDEQTVIAFGHRGWREVSEFTAHCSMKWATFLLSLRAFVETGKGRPAPDDLKIDTWN